MRDHSRRNTESALARNCSLAFRLVVLVLLALPVPHSSAQQEPTNAADTALKAAICPIVYPSDETPRNKGYRYTFFGNAFFINAQGYLVTAAHVLETFRDVGQPYILVDRSMAPPQLLKANIIAIDWTHDVAILRAAPNPFEGKYRVAFLPLAGKRVQPGDAVVASALHPANIRNASTYQMPVQDWSSAQVLGFVQTHEEPQLPETDLFTFSHEVQKGQSGSPVLSAASREVTGVVDGRWLRPTSIAPSKKGTPPYSGPIGAAVPVDYLIQLLQKNSISWTTVPAANLPPPSL